MSSGDTAEKPVPRALTRASLAQKIPAADWAAALPRERIYSLSSGQNQRPVSLERASSSSQRPISERSHPIPVIIRGKRGSHWRWPGR